MDYHQKEASVILCHYFRLAGVDLTDNMRSEIAKIVENIIESAVARSKKEMWRELKNARP